MKKFAFYGTLRVGQGNYRAFNLDSRGRNLGTAIVDGFSMIDLGHYPMAFEDSKGKIHVDLIEIEDERTAEGIKRMELGAGYKEVEIEVNGEKYLLYVSVRDRIDMHLPDNEIVPGGDWVKYNTEKMINAKRRQSVCEC